MREVRLGGAIKGALIGGVAAGVVNVGLYFVGAALGADYKPKDPAALGGLEVLPAFQPLLICVIAAVASCVFLAIASKVTPTKAWPLYLVASVVVFLLEFYAPFWAFADMTTIVMLEIMHLPATIGIVGGVYAMGVRERTTGG